MEVLRGAGRNGKMSSKVCLCQPLFWGILGPRGRNPPLEMDTLTPETTGVVPSLLGVSVVDFRGRRRSGAGAR